MSTKSIAVDYGDRQIEIEVPDTAVIAEFRDPPLLENPEQAVRDALAKPYGSPPLAELAKPGMRVAIGFDDPTRPNVPPRTILPIVVETLLAAGVNERDIVFISGCSNHRKPTRLELANHLGAEIFNRFWLHGQIINHDCYDPAQLRYFGITESGRYVEHNRHFVDADLLIYQGNVASTAWKSYTGTGAVIGLASTPSIASHHSYHSIPVPSNLAGKESKPRRKVSVKDEMNGFLEQATGRKIFYINAVNGTKGRMAGVFAGSAREVRPPAWELAERIYRCPVPEADVLIVGLPQSYSYGSSHNPLIAAVGALVPPRYSADQPVLREGGVVIGLTPSTGYIDPRLYPDYQAVIDLYGRYHTVRALVDHEEAFDHRPDYRHKYTYENGYPPLHAFWLFYEMEYALNRAGAVILAGTPNPGVFRGLGLTPAKDFSQAWKIAAKYVGKNPSVVVAPTFWSKPRIKFDVRAD
jgi:nickel-dependent lactate racemase